LLLCKGNLLWESSKKGSEARFVLLWESCIETWASEAEYKHGGQRRGCCIPLEDITRVDIQEDGWTLYVSTPKRQDIRRFKAMEGHDIARWTSHLGRLIPNKVSSDGPKVVLTIQISAQDRAESPLTILATHMSGNEIASCQLLPKQSLADLRDALATDLGTPAFTLQLVATTGQLLDESRNAQPLSEVFSEIFQ